MSVVLAASASAHAAPDNRTAVDVRALTPDQVGKRLVHQLRELLARSAIFRQQVPDDKTYVVISLVTMDAEADPSRAGRGAVYSFAVTFAPSRQSPKLHLSHTVGDCGTGRVAACAETLFADMAESYEEFARVN